MNKRQLRAVRVGESRTRLQNPYYDAYLEYYQNAPPVRGAYGIQEMPAVLRQNISWFEAREQLCNQYAWAVPDRAAIQVLLDHSPLVEIGAGRGYWAWLVTQLGGEVVAYDKDPPQISHENHYHPHGQVFVDVQLGGYEEIQRHPEHTLFLCWPPYAASMAHKCLQAYRGSRVILVGEGWGGCTADDAFWEMLDAKFSPVIEYQDIPQWFGLNDYLSVWERAP